MNEWMDGWMSKQIDKQTNNKRLALKKGQIDILEALYWCRFGGCWLFWVRLGYPRIYLPYQAHYLCDTFISSYANPIDQADNFH